MKSVFKNKMSDDYYTLNVIREFKNKEDKEDKEDTNYNLPIYQRNPSKKYKLTLNHIELIEYFVRMIKPNNFLELGVQYGETTKRILPHIKQEYFAVDIECDENVNYFKENYNNFIFIKRTTD